ncbi:MAG: hypothetical protein EU540_01290 [Promethearchaeota archaeon]|nr:MAG: hypothetical protein EU540_01290 [Candidatus Lokiarchaeota archaeon]
MSKRFKKSKKEEQITIEENLGHLFFRDIDLRLLMLRPIDLIEFSEFAGANSEDIVIWVGKTVAKYFIEKLYGEANWSEETLSNKKEAIVNVLDAFEHLGYGILTSAFLKDKIFISVENPISQEEKDNIMAKNICILYQGIFNGVLEQIGIDADGEEVQCFLKDDEADIFKYDLLIDEFDAKDIDSEINSGPISNYMERYNV